MENPNLCKYVTSYHKKKTRTENVMWYSQNKTYSKSTISTPFTKSDPCISLKLFINISDFESSYSFILFFLFLNLSQSSSSNTQPEKNKDQAKKIKQEIMNSLLPGSILTL